MTTAAAVIAFLFFLAGIILLIGNLTGSATSFPLAGFLFMTIGGLIGRAAKE